jgi:hypothetical protein
VEGVHGAVDHLSDACLAEDNQFDRAGGGGHRKDAAWV